MLWMFSNAYSCIASHACYMAATNMPDSHYKNCY